MNEDDVRNREESIEEDELMQEVSTPPEFAAATREQVERTWQAIADHVEALPATETRASDPATTARHADPSIKKNRRPPSGWFESLFPQVPAWSWQFAKVAALIVVGFGAAWIVARQGWLPGTASTEIAVTPLGLPDTTPDRAWLAGNGYGSRLEALLLGVAKGNTAADRDVGPAAREVSRELLNDNRFYQRVAQRNDDAALSDLLSRVEVILLALATAPAGQEQDVIITLREFINESDMLDELREVQSSVPRLPRPRAAAVGS